jgi:hypothetical protein
MFGSARLIKPGQYYAQSQAGIIKKGQYTFA